MEFDNERLARECEKVVSRVRIILKDKGGPVIMNSLAFILAEAMFNTSSQPNWAGNLKHVFKAVEEHLEEFATEAAKVTEGEAQ
ncbi:MAG: hypothetical protein AMJ59_12835 [Gammaproteobacteria bacterium SG8_31]|nr:MAG: hypothetical protein AMJ59_12835 [Gammaproteobacteria bacterium SG8_31]